MNEEVFVKYLKELNIIPSKEMLAKLKIYCEFLQEYNEHTNLTAITNTNDIYLKHFYDSLTIIKVIDLTKINTLLDIGTGAGFPGLVLKIFYPHLEVTLLDSNNKKIKFLEELCEKLDIKVNLVHQRAEEYIKEKREYFDLVTSRAVASLPILSELSLPYVKVNGYFIALKGEISKELEASTKILTALDSKIVTQKDFTLPFEESKRTIIKITKLKPTNPKYPRSYKQILKENKQ